MKNEKAAPPRAHDRAAEEIRPVRIELDVMKFAEGSALIELGDTRVLTAQRRHGLCGGGKTASVAEHVGLPSALNHLPVGVVAIHGDVHATAA